MLFPLSAFLTGLAILSAASPAVAAIDVTPVAGPGTAIATGPGGLGSGHYTGTLTTNFQPSQIQPGQGFTYTSGLRNEDGFEWETDCQPGGQGNPYDWPFIKVAAGGNQWEHSLGFTSLSGQHATDTCYGNGFWHTETTHVVPGASTELLEPGCYQSTNWNAHLVFPGSENTSGSISTLTVGNANCGTENECTDGENNDFDGLIDALDPGCAGGDTTELGEVECDNGLDDDTDGATDWPMDQAGCDDVFDDREREVQCADSQDNDADGRNNFPADPGCANAQDDSEAPDPECGDRRSNDKDDLVDMADPGCSNRRDNSEIDYVTLKIEIDGPGEGYGCRDSCQWTLERGTQLTATAVPDEPNDGFLSWKGCDIALGDRCHVSLDEDQNIQASFDPIVTYAPWMSYHPREKWWPMDPATFIAKSSLRWANLGARKYRPCSNKRTVAIRAKGAFSAAGLARGAYTHRYCWRKKVLGRLGSKKSRTFNTTQLTSPSIKNKPGTRLGRSGFYLDLKKKFRKGIKPTGNNGPPIYVEYEPDRYVIYWLFSGKNEVDWNPPGPGPAARDLHEGDWEHIVVRLNDHNRASNAAYYQHICPGETHTWAKMKSKGWLRDDTHPKVYVALGAHASYPRVPALGKVPVACRQFGGLWDVLKKGGQTWTTWARGSDGFRRADAQPWYGFGGGWGSDAGSSPGSWPGPFWGPLGPGPLKMKDALPKGW